MRFFFLFTILISLQTLAQPFSGDFSNPNRRGKVTIIDIQPEFQQWQMRSQPEISVKIHFREPNDSVVVYRNAIVSGHFITHHDRIVSPCLVLRDEMGRIQSIDSFRPSGVRFGDAYFANFVADLAVHREYYSSGIPYKAHYRNIAGSDSLKMEWSPDGVIRWKQQGGIEYRYTSNGVLSSASSWKDSLVYRNGILAYTEKDTVVLEQWVRLVREYSPKGTLLKEKWFKGDKPVATWREYTPEGTLLKTINHPALAEEIMSYEIMDADYPAVFEFVTEMAEYPGGRDPLYKFMQSELQSVVSSCDLPLQGMYKIHFEVGEDGKPLFISVEGENASAMESSLKSVIERMPLWKPSKRSGMRVREGLVLNIKVSG